ncbi:hypothetical protein [Nonomuraea jiangxiensis]|uniref:Uncharacterized protein n=1 Tax=Nonomuraea jiangxiensis TaxID=633440 RepID=A0A1G7ZVA8_9ACTN|nr:hypothetical protein [Nonomuraea jiangxiensis]SDH12625.1 hypothetical protein SAMN05421869_101536 [Nonomuraea jiangxiensis]
MTRYSVDHARNVLIAHWSTGIGDAAGSVADLPPASADRDTLRLAAFLTELSQTCWRCYTHPASTADRHGPGSLGWHRQRERDAFAAVVPALTGADRPATGASSPEVTKIEEIAHRVGEALRAFDAPPLTEAVVADVSTELAAVEQAERGDLSRRAQQAVALSREDASPLQVAQADTLLREHPFGPEALFTQIDPAAAAIAAAHWLHAAVTVTARLTSLHPAQIVTGTDPAKPLAPESIAEITATICGGTSPRQAVMPLIRHALLVAEGHLCGVSEAEPRIFAAEQLIDKAPAEVHLELDTVCLAISPLDPARPALDLLENLLYGIRDCLLTYQQYVEEGSRESLRTEAFLAELRREAAAHRARLL